MLPRDPPPPEVRDRLFRYLQLGLWAIMVLLCVIVGILWARVEAQVRLNEADIMVLKAYADVQAQRVRDEGQVERARQAQSWRVLLIPTLRQHHQTLQALPLPGEYVQPLPEWLQEKP